MVSTSPTVLIFVQTGCGYCHEFMQRFKPLADPYHRRGLRIKVGDIARSRSAQQLADRYQVRATPTVIGIGRNGTITLEGAVNDAQIKKMLKSL